MPRNSKKAAISRAEIVLPLQQNIYLECMVSTTFKLVWKDINKNIFIPEYFK